MKRAIGSTLLLAALHASAAPAGAQEARLLRQPTVSETHVAFAYAGDIWIVGREGGEARRLTSFPGVESGPQLSPDGRWVAFGGQYGGNTDVYVVPAAGGEPRRLTWHPGADVPRGWTPDGARVVFASGRINVPIPIPRFWTVALDGGFPEALPMPRAEAGMFSPDGSRYAYQPITQWESQMRNYRGGQIRPIWVLDLDDYDLEKLPWEGSNDRDPVWLGDGIYFLSDRDWATNVWGYDTRTKELKQLTFHADYDVQDLAAGGGTLAYEQAGWIWLLDPATGQAKRLDVTVRGDFAWALPHWEQVARRLTNPSLSPTGVRALFEARGEIFTVPTDEGDWRNLTNSPGVADRNPTWSPDGKHIAWFSDRGGKYRLVIAEQDGITGRRELDLPNKFYYTPSWSPDSKKILFTDTDLNLWWLDVATGKATRVDTDAYMVPERTIDPVWSPDSRWIAYAKRLDNQFHTVFVHDVQTGRTEQVTDGLSDALHPAWDAGGKYLWFLASTNLALNTGWLDMSSYERPLTRGLYLAVLKAGEPSPLLPEKGDEKAAGAERSGGDAKASAGGAKDEKGAKNGEKDVRVEIDFEGIRNRILAVDVPLRHYEDLRAGAEGVVFYAENVPNQPGATLRRYSLEDREAKEFASGVRSWALSHDGKKLLYRTGLEDWAVADAGKPPAKPGEGKLKVAGLRMRVDPPAEWRQIFEEAWRLERDYLYVPNMHGADWDAVRRMYSPLVEHVRHRSDLTYILDMMTGELTLAHTYVGGGDLPDVDTVSIGLLGADLEPADGRYRIRRIYTGESWNPELRAPLAAPGVDVSEGDYILEVDGVELRAPDNPYRLFEGKANRQTVLRVNDRPATEGSRLVTVVPVTNETPLRARAWVEDNRRKVDELSGGRLAYVYLPNTAGAGYTYFNRYYFAQQHKQGAIIDERFNGGGSAADYMVDIMARKLHGFFNNPVGDRRPFTTPGAGIWGPKVMVVNEGAGSGGDFLPYMFRHMEIGPLVGKRTWGGLVGIWDTPPLVDGGFFTAPRGGFYNLEGEWDVENEGVAPDIEVENEPKEVIAGRDPQLERAVQEALRLLEQNPVRILPEPPPPQVVRRPAAKASGQR